MIGQQPDWFASADPRGEFWTEERCYIIELLGGGLSPEASLAVARVEPGTTTQLHSLTGVSEGYILRKGEGIVEIAGVRRHLRAGDQAVIGPGVAQRIRNTGTGDLEFYCLCVPAFHPGCYVNLEDQNTPPL
jgi:mannose-6-phosphate isomerase-like protein (cupin superfamily)